MGAGYGTAGWTHRITLGLGACNPNSRRGRAMKRCCTKHCAQAHGYLLVEMLVIIGLIGIALLIEAQLFRTAMKLISGEPAAANEMISLNHLTTQLRRDVWAAQTI